jgi:bacterioferritin-associated ferredoxin
MKLTFTKEHIDEAIKNGCKTISELNDFILGVGLTSSLRLLIK